MKMREPVLIVGAGMAGLCCAADLIAAGVPVRIIEASDAVGGRVRTDVVDGFLVDRGFQVLLTAYPELRRRCDLDALELRPFAPGAMVWMNGRGHVVSDPLRDPRQLWSTITAPIGSPLDKARIALLRRRVRSVHPVELLRGEEMTTAAALREAGFSDKIIQRFFRPLVGGIQLDPDLTASRRMFDVIFRMLADGDAAVPAAGMGAVPAQIARAFPEGTVELSIPVTAIGDGHVTVPGPAGRSIKLKARAVVVATEGPVAAELLSLPSVGSRSVGSVWFAAPTAPTGDRYIILDGSGQGPALNVAVMSAVAPSYAPVGQHLIAVATPGVMTETLQVDVRAQLRNWWGSQVDRWELLATHRIAHGQPRLGPPLHPAQKQRIADGVFVCGDHRDTPSIQGAMYSGRRAAAQVLRALGVTHTDRTLPESDPI
jgi:phytoene dehydrogenase-like protein